MRPGGTARSTSEENSALPVDDFTHVGDPARPLFGPARSFAAWARRPPSRQLQHAILVRRFAELDRARTGRTQMPSSNQHAQTWLDFREAARLFEVPAQNLVYADVEGHIGYQSPGRIPIRPSGPGRPMGRWPAAGWTNEDEWLGFIPFEELPSAYDPPEGYIVTANNAVAAPTYPNYLTDEWAYGYRSQRIVERIEELDTGIDIAAMSDIQRDTRNGNAAYLVPMLLNVQLEPWDREAQELLRNWDYSQPADSAAAAYFNAVWKNLLSITFDDELPEATRPDGGDRWFEVVRRLMDAPTRLVGHVTTKTCARRANRLCAGAGRCTRGCPLKARIRASGRGDGCTVECARPWHVGIARSSGSSTWTATPCGGPSAWMPWLECRRELRSQLGAIDADGRRSRRSGSFSLDQPDGRIGTRVPPPLLRSGRPLGGRSYHHVAVDG